MKKSIPDYDPEDWFLILAICVTIYWLSRFVLVRNSSGAANGQAKVSAGREGGGLGLQTCCPHDPERHKSAAASTES